MGYRGHEAVRIRGRGTVTTARSSVLGERRLGPTVGLDVRARRLVLEAARFITAPPVSADDLKTLVGGNVGQKRPDEKRAAEAARIVRSAWDPIRFPWLRENRRATETERNTAILWTASIWAIESMRTYQGNTPLRAQEAQVSDALTAAGFEPVRTRFILSLEDIDRGTFTAGECRVGDHKCDRAVRLHDGRLLAIECKVSNSAVNSKKRLNNDVGAKAAAWRKSFGEQLITAAVLSGVYSLGNLVSAQSHDGVTILWAHDLKPLVAFVRDAR
ncbi:MAG: XamI family restriction endonuclease [Chloroflexota bacterium]|nr:XamI family restriction endonuclease [Chloroflexota bacterium]